MSRRRTITVLAVAALSLTAAACGSTDHTGTGHQPTTGPTPTSSAATSTPHSDTAHNDADITFAQQMIPHHQQAVDMATMAETRAAAPEVKTLAAEIKNAQGPEIAQMTGWLSAWGATPAPPAGHGGGHGGVGAMNGMMTEQEMAAMQAATGASFDRMFLEMMIRHHQGAIDMAETEQTQGLNPQAKTLAGQIITSQSAEITRMQTLRTGS